MQMIPRFPWDIVRQEGTIRLVFVIAERRQFWHFSNCLILMSYLRNFTVFICLDVLITWTGMDTSGHRFLSVCFHLRPIGFREKPRKSCVQFGRGPFAEWGDR